MRVTCGDKCSLNKNTLTVCDSERNSDRKRKMTVTAADNHMDRIGEIESDCSSV